MDNKWALGPLRPDEQVTFKRIKFILLDIVYMFVLFQTYESVVQMIEYHRRVPIIIHADNKVLGSTCLVCWPLESAC